MNVLVFKTNMVCDGCKRTAATALNQFGEAIRWNADLEDCDKILRVATVDMPEPPIMADDIIRVMQEAGFICEELV